MQISFDFRFTALLASGSLSLLLLSPPLMMLARPYQPKTSLQSRF
jgi:hypothetical protein